MPVFIPFATLLYNILMPFLLFSAGIVVFVMAYQFLSEIFTYLVSISTTIKSISNSFNSSIPQVVQLYEFFQINKFILMIITAYLLSISITLTMVAIKAFGRRIPTRT